MSKLTIRNLIIASVFLAVTLGAFIFALYITESKNTILNEQLTALEKRQAQEATYRKLQRIAEESKADRELVNEYFLAEESDSIDFLNTVETLALQSGVALETESLKKDTDSKTKEEWLTVQFSFNGGYSEVTDFVKTLENIPYIAEITEVSLKAGTESNWEARVTMRINIYKYAE